MKKNEPAAPPANDEIYTDPDLRTILDQLPESRRVSIKRMSESNSRWAYIGSLNADIFNEDAVQKRFGGGLYQFALHGSDGKLLRTISNIEIADLPDDEREVKTVAPAQTIPAASSEIQLLREQMAADRLVLMKLIDSLGNARQQPPQQSLTDLVAALATLKGMEPKRETPPEVQDLVMKSFTQGLELAGKIQGRVSGEASPMSELIGFARDIFKDAQPIIMDLLKKPPAKPAAPGVAPAAIAPATLENPPEEEETELDLTPALTFIKDHLKNGFDPTALAHVVLQQMKGNPELNETVAAIVMEQPIDEIVTLDAELAAEPLRTKFGEFFGVLRARISADSPAT